MKRNFEDQSTMAEINGFVYKHQNPSLQSLLHCLDPISLILSQQNPNSDNQPSQLSLATESFVMERGPRYRAYAELRESRLRMRHSVPELSEEPELIRVLTPPKKKQVKFQTNSETTKRKVSNFSSSIVAQSVPDFSSVLRKENRRPPMAAMMETTPPAKAKSAMSNSKGSKSAGAGDKRRPSAARKSYASIEELKGLSMAASTAINGGGRRTVLGYRAL